MSCKHEWHRDFDKVGGLRETPGVFGAGSAIKLVESCRKCGLYREKIIGDVGHPSRNHDWEVVDEWGTPI